MAQIFPPSTNTISRVSILGALIVVAGTAWVVAAVQRSSWNTDVGLVRQQPVPFSHEHHVDGLGIDCRYCHPDVTVSAYAGMPSTQTCMSCHSHIWTDADLLEPVRQSYRQGDALRWKRIYDLADFVFFDHSIHVRKGIGCSTCHGRVDLMPLTWKAETLHMDWCLECHRDPTPHLRPPEEVFDMAWTPPADQAERGAALLERYRIRGSQLSNCSICHR